MALIVLLRHGQAQNNVEKVLAGRTPGFDLTQEGVEQARSAARMLEPLNISSIYSSPIARARHTAEIIAEDIPAEIRMDDCLTELDMGKFTGMRYADIEPVYGNVFEKFYTCSPEVEASGIETFDKVRKRMAEMTERMVESHGNETVLLVTHMDPIKAMLANVAGFTPRSLYRLIIANASLNVFGQNGGSVYLLGLNVTDAARFNQAW